MQGSAMSDALSCIPTSSHLKRVRGKHSYSSLPACLNICQLFIILSAFQLNLTSTHAQTVTPTVVVTPEQLESAIKNATPHILIQKHLDLRNLTGREDKLAGELFYFQPKTLSIQGDCSSPPDLLTEGDRESISPPLELRPGQCLLLTEAGLGRTEVQSGTDIIDADSVRLWIDNLFVQRLSFGVDVANPAMLGFAGAASTVWTTNVTLQGEGQLMTALQVGQEVSFLAQDSSFNAFDVSGTNHPVLLAQQNSITAFTNCSFAENTAVGAGLFAFEHFMRLEGNTFDRNAVTNDLDNRVTAMSISDKSFLYSDPEQNYTIFAEDGVQKVSLPLEAADEDGGPTFPSLDSDDFAQLSKSLPALQYSAAVVEAPKEAPAPSRMSTTQRNIAIGGVVAGTILIAAFAGLLVVHHKRSSRPKPPPVAGSTPYNKLHNTKYKRTSSSSTATSASRSRGMPKNVYTTLAANRTSPTALMHSSCIALDGPYASVAPEARRVFLTTDQLPTKDDETYNSGMFLVASPTPAAMNVNASPVDQLEDALDSLFLRQERFMQEFEVLSSIERRAGGQGVVQFARLANTSDEVAIKFYLHKNAFDRERHLYMDDDLRCMMPATQAIVENANNEVRAANGFVFPPCIIIERGESLDEWAKRETPDFITIMQVLCHLATRLRIMHAKGYIHRDLKPGNVLRLKQQHAWTLIDFGCVAKAGVRTSISYSLAYAPPEVISTLESGQKHIVVSEAVDMWALGVIAYELLTKSQAFPYGMPRSEVVACITGQKMLPWELPETIESGKLTMLRGLRRSILMCLDRDPTKRPSADRLLASWNHMFYEHTTAVTQGTESQLLGDGWTDTEDVTDIMNYPTEQPTDQGPATLVSTEGVA